MVHSQVFTLAGGALALGVALGACAPEDGVLEPLGGGDAGRDAAAPKDGSDPDAAGLPPDAAPGGGDATPGGDVDPGCDLRGVWAARQTTFNQESVLSTVQTASNWYYLVLDQAGERLVVTEHMDCGIKVTGQGLADVTTTLEPAAIEGMLRVNSQVGRAASVRRVGERCELQFARFWSVRGAETSLLDARDAPLSVAQLEAEKPLPTQQSPQGATDPDGDGTPGLRFDVSGLGNRNTAQRDWTEWFTDDEYTLAAGAARGGFTIRVRFDNQENLLAADPDTGLLKASSRPMNNKKHRVDFRWLGPSEASPEVQAFLGATDLETCRAIQQLIPHEKIQE